MKEFFRFKKKASKPILEIRGHHLRIYAAYNNGEITRGEAASIIYNNAKMLRKGVRENDPSVNDLYPTDEIREAELYYFDDTIGNTKKQEDLFLKRNDELFRFFDKLPDKSTVAVVAGKPDTMCKTCTGAGAHCSMKDMRKINGSSNSLGVDIMHSALFLKAAEDTGVLKEIKESTEIVNFSDAPSEKVSRYEMPSSVFKNVLTHISQSHYKYLF